MDIKAMYQDKAEELALEQYGESVEFYELPAEEQMRLYSKAEELVNSEIVSRADSLRHELKLKGEC